MSTGQIQNTHIDSDTVRVLAVPSRETDVETASVCVIYDAAAVPSSSEGVHDGHEAQVGVLSKHKHRF